MNVLRLALTHRVVDHFHEVRDMPVLNEHDHVAPARRVRVGTESARPVKEELVTRLTRFGVERSHPVAAVSPRAVAPDDVLEPEDPSRGERLTCGSHSTSQGSARPSRVPPGTSAVEPLATGAEAAPSQSRASVRGGGARWRALAEPLARAGRGGMIPRAACGRHDAGGAA